MQSEALMRGDGEMMTFPELCHDIFRDIGEVDYDELPEIELRRLCASYVRGNPEILEDLLTAIKPECIAEEIATLIEYNSRSEALEHCDVFDLAQEILAGVFPNKDLESLVIGELDHQWRRWCATAGERESEERAELTDRRSP